MAIRLCCSSGFFLAAIIAAFYVPLAVFAFTLLTLGEMILTRNDFKNQKLSLPFDAGGN